MREWENNTVVLLEDLQEGDLEALEEYFLQREVSEGAYFGSEIVYFEQGFIPIQEDCVGLYGEDAGLWWTTASQKVIITREEAISIVKCEGLS